MNLIETIKRVLTGDLHPRAAARQTGLTVANVMNLARMIERVSA